MRTFCMRDDPASNEQCNEGAIALQVNTMDTICIAVRDLEQARKVGEQVPGKRAPDGACVDAFGEIRVACDWLGEFGLELT